MRTRRRKHSIHCIRLIDDERTYFWNFDGRGKEVPMQAIVNSGPDRARLPWPRPSLPPISSLDLNGQVFLPEPNAPVPGDLLQKDVLCFTETSSFPTPILISLYNRFNDSIEEEEEV
jgi:hypothetical protein